MKELKTFRKYLNEGVINEEIEKEDIDNMADLEDNAEYQEAYNNIGANAVEENDSKIDYKILDKELKEFLSYYNITFEVDLREKLFYDALDAVKEYR